MGDGGCGQIKNKKQTDIFAKVFPELVYCHKILTCLCVVCCVLWMLFICLSCIIIKDLYRILRVGKGKTLSTFCL